MHAICGRPMMTRGVVLAAALVLHATALLGQAYRARVRLPTHSQVIALDTLAIRTELTAPAAEVFAVTAAVLELELKIELKTRDSTAGLVGNLELVKMRTLGDALSRYLICGVGMTGPNAELSHLPCRHRLRRSAAREQNAARRRCHRRSAGCARERKAACRVRFDRRARGTRASYRRCALRQCAQIAARYEPR